MSRAGAGAAPSVATREAALARGFAAHPAGLSPLFFTELWERFSYYGMRALLTLFMVAPVAVGGLGLTLPEAAVVYGNYTMAVYLLAIPGGFLADAGLGARRAVLWGGLIIMCGHIALAVPARPTFYVGLVLVALGSGLMKPNISAMVGGLYAPDDDRRDAGFSLFYLGINLGAFVAPLVTGFLAQSEMVRAWLAARGIDPSLSWHFGFAAAAAGMSLGLLVFVRSLPDLGRTREPPPVVAPGLVRRAAWVLAMTAAIMALVIISDWPGLEGLRWAFLLAPVATALVCGFSRDPMRRRLGAVAVFFIASMLFWAVFEQAGISIAVFCDRLTRTEIADFAFPSTWFQSLNPIFVIALAPVFATAWARLGPRQPSSPAKFVAALLFLALSFTLMVPAAQATATGKISPWWIVGLFLLQTIGELFLSPVGLSLMTRLAPPGLVGVTLGLWFLSVAWGNKLAGVLGAGFDATDAGGLARFFLHQAVLLGLAAVMLAFLVPTLKRLMGDAR